MNRKDYCKQYHSPEMDVLVVCTDSIIAESLGEKPGQWMPSPSETPFFPEV